MCSVPAWTFSGSKVILSFMGPLLEMRTCFLSTMKRHTLPSWHCWQECMFDLWCSVTGHCWKIFCRREVQLVKVWMVFTHQTLRQPQLLCVQHKCLLFNICLLTWRSVLKYHSWCKEQKNVGKSNHDPIRFKVGWFIMFYLLLQPTCCWNSTSGSET